MNKALKMQTSIGAGYLSLPLLGRHAFTIWSGKCLSIKCSLNVTSSNGLMFTIPNPSMAIEYCIDLLMWLAN